MLYFSSIKYRSCICVALFHFHREWNDQELLSFLRCVITMPKITPRFDLFSFFLLQWIFVPWIFNLFISVIRNLFLLILEIYSIHDWFLWNLINFLVINYIILFWKLYNYYLLHFFFSETCSRGVHASRQLTSAHARKTCEELLRIKLEIRLGKALCPRC